MGKNWRALRRRILTPNVSATLMNVRGFNKKDPSSQDLLETVGRTFLKGYAYAAEARTVLDAEQDLETVPTRFRGFAYEGAAMGYAMRDGLPFSASDHVSNFLAGRAAQHDYMAYIGVGWAMARLPRFRWPSSAKVDPFMQWLVLDGYGFHQAYFHTQRYVHEQYRAQRFPWPAAGPSWYRDRALDLGIGRALWFVAGTDPHVAAGLIAKYSTDRHPDLYAGAGLAAAYAGGVTEEELEAFVGYASEHCAQVAQGAAFAAEARVKAGLLGPHTELATKILCGLSAERAAELTRETKPSAAQEGDVPAYEVWRQRTVNELLSLGRS